jgi:hypothetical protein
MIDLYMGSTAFMLGYTRYVAEAVQHSRSWSVGLSPCSYSRLALMSGMYERSNEWTIWRTIQSDHILRVSRSWSSTQNTVSLR